MYVEEGYLSDYFVLLDYYLDDYVTETYFEN
jgi:hypothetical protein